MCSPLYVNRSLSVEIALVLGLARHLLLTCTAITPSLQGNAHSFLTNACFLFYLSWLCSIGAAPGNSQWQEGITKVHWREYKGTIPVISVCVEELSQAEQACFACLGELATPLSAKYHQQHDEGDKKSANARPATAPKSPSKLEDDLLHLYVFSWTAHGQSVQNSILQTYVATGEAEESPPPSSSRPKGIERTIFCFSPFFPLCDPQ